MSDNHEYLDDVNKQLLHISELLEKILVEQQRTNLAFDNIGEEIAFKEEIVCRELFDVDSSKLTEKNLFFIGFRKQDVKRFVEQIGTNVTYVPSVEHQGDFIATVTNCKENDTLLLNCGGINKTQELLDLITDTIDDGKLNVKIGKGTSARTINLDLPKINYIFFETTCFLVPRVLRDAVDCCVWNENDRKRD